MAAASGDGMVEGVGTDGAVVPVTTTGVSNILQNIGATANAHAFVPVGNKSFALTFTYDLSTITNRDEMAEGAFRVQIPTSEGWSVTDKSLTPVPQSHGYYCRYSGQYRCY